jgi:hypothetical protein
LHEDLSRCAPEPHAIEVSARMTLQLPELFPWRPVHLRGLPAMRGFYEARNILADGTFATETVGAIGTTELVAVCSTESAERGGSRLCWTSLWTYHLAHGRVAHVDMQYSLSDEVMATFWTEVALPIGAER